MKWWLTLLLAVVLGASCCCVGSILALVLTPSAIREAAWSDAGRDILPSLQGNKVLQTRLGTALKLENATELTVLLEDPDVLAWQISGNTTRKTRKDHQLIARVATDVENDRDTIDWAILRTGNGELIALVGNPPLDSIGRSLGDPLAEQFVETFHDALETSLGQNVRAAIDWQGTNELDGETDYALVVSAADNSHASAQVTISWDNDNDVPLFSNAILILEHGLAHTLTPNSELDSESRE